MRMRRAIITFISASTLLAPGAAGAQDGVTVDPDSPSGKQYAIPLESVRRQTDASDDKRQPTKRPAPLFGEGLKSDDEETPVGGSGTGTSGGSGSDDGGGSGQGSAGSTLPSTSGGGSLSTTEPDVVRQAADRSGETPGSSGSLVVAGLLAVGVCGGAAATGFALRRRGEGPSPA